MTPYWNALKQAVLDFFNDRGFVWAAALAFYAALSFAPLVMLTLYATAQLGPDVQARVVEQFGDLLGGAAGDTLGEIIDNAEKRETSGFWATIVSVGVLIFSASGVFGQLQAALNAIWDVRAKPGNSILAFLRSRLLSLGMIGSLLFLLLLSLGASAVLNAVLGGFGLAWVVNQAVTLGVYLLLFAAMYKLLPDVRLTWRDTLISAAVTAVLFAVGKAGIGLYLGRAAVGSSYGAAGSLMALLVWVYYASVVVLFGAELSQSLFAEFDKRIKPSKHAERVPEQAAAI
ncbi:YihY/virulence factor BrkB family protein [Phycisphaera mikurensis]|nr:YihY/virulence factor BrkB family protein [Phycisphaera mikurensis]MBB6441102.1 membrane protein [Phycisphaera mikurensis]